MTLICGVTRWPTLSLRERMGHPAVVATVDGLGRLAECLTLTCNSGVRCFSIAMA
jgi:hypothetical protein